MTPEAGYWLRKAKAAQTNEAKLKALKNAFEALQGSTAFSFLAGKIAAQIKNLES